MDEPGRGAARTASAAPSAWSRSTKTWSICAASSKTSPAGAGHRHRHGDRRSTPTSHSTPEIALPPALTPDVDRALMTAVANLDDWHSCVPACCCEAATRMRIGELLDLELDCLLDFARHGTWLRVPVGKLNSERSAVPLEPDTVQVIDACIAAKRARQQRAAPPPRRQAD